VSKYIRREVVRECAIHQSIMHLASENLESRGAFRKLTIIDDLGLRAMEDSIRWDYIRDFLQEDQDCELVPVAESYFKQHQMSEELLNPEKFIATGYGKKTAGFVSVIVDTDHLVIKRLEQRAAVANGVGKAFRSYAEAVQEKRIGIGVVKPQELLPVSNK
jgi:hypothetical protein